MILDEVILEGVILEEVRYSVGGIEKEPAPVDNGSESPYFLHWL